MDTLFFIEELVGLLAWPVPVVAVAWATRGPLLALAASTDGLWRPRPAWARDALPLDQEATTR